MASIPSKGPAVRTRPPRRKWLVVLIVFALAAVVVLAVILFRQYRPVDIGTVVRVRLEMRNLLDEPVDITLANTDAAERVAEFEPLAYKNRGVNGLVKAPTWEITITYIRPNGSTVRSYRGQKGTEELLAGLRNIPELVERDPRFRDNRSPTTTAPSEEGTGTTTSTAAPDEGEASAPTAGRGTAGTTSSTTTTGEGVFPPTGSPTVPPGPGLIARRRGDGRARYRQAVIVS